MGKNKVSKERKDRKIENYLKELKGVIGEGKKKGTLLNIS